MTSSFGASPEAGLSASANIRRTRRRRSDPCLFTHGACTPSAAHHKSGRMVPPSSKVAVTPSRPGPPGQCFGPTTSPPSATVRSQQRLGVACESSACRVFGGTQKNGGDGTQRPRAPDACELRAISPDFTILANVDVFQHLRGGSVDGARHARCLAPHPGDRRHPSASRRSSDAASVARSDGTPNV